MGPLARSVDVAEADGVEEMDRVSVSRHRRRPTATSRRTKPRDHNSCLGHKNHEVRLDLRLVSGLPSQKSARTLKPQRHRDVGEAANAKDAPSVAI